MSAHSPHDHPSHAPKDRAAGDPVGATTPSHHRHLRVVPNAAAPKSGYAWRRPVVIAASLGAVAAFLASLAAPWWKLQLYAPQYPRGLTLIIWLRKLEGDVHEITTLNHYIGMASLEDAAQFEKRIAVYAVGALAVISLATMLFLGRRFSRWLFVPGLLFPLGFIVDSFYWMYTFGHNLDPKAPLNIPPFTPQLFGNGTIGQFMTFAVPQLGFWLAVGGVGLLFIASMLRGQVCASCARAGTCGAVCSTGFVLEPKADAP